jgi:nucleoside-diphosphate-sugar epimerase
MMRKIAILGATGPTGTHLATILRARGETVRAVARDPKRLAEALPDPAIEKFAADVADAGNTLRAVEGCDLVYDCIGLPGDQMHLHGVTARNIAHALGETKARCVQVSSYWAYYPQVRAVMDETHPRADGSPWMRHRRDAEDILLKAGAAVLHLPDFYGPLVHVSTLQSALREAAQGKTVNWLGRADTTREYIYVPDAMRIAADIGGRPEAFGQHWCLPGGGPLSGRSFATITFQRLGRKFKLRAAGLTMLRIVSLFNRELRGFMQVAPDYMKPVRYDAGKLESMLGRQVMTPYDRGIAQTLDWLTAGVRP